MVCVRCIGHEISMLERVCASFMIPVSIWAPLSMSDVPACDGNGKCLIFSNGRSIKLRNHTGKTRQTNAHTWTNKNSRSATVAWKNTWIWNGLCLWSKSANLLMPLSESIHFLPWINKLLSHVLTLFCLLSDRSLLFRSIFEYQIWRFQFSVQNRSYSSQTF